MSSANEYGQVWLGVNDRGGSRGRYISVKPTDSADEAPSGLEAIFFSVGVRGGSVWVYLTVEEAQAVLAQLEYVLDAVRGAAV
jgi:hypothetical protein